MKKLTTTQILIALAVAVNVIWAFDSLASGTQSRSGKRASELMRKHSCSPGNGCYPDLNGDGTDDFVTYESEGQLWNVWLVGYVEGYVVLRLPNGKDEESRPLLAVNRVDGKDRLLVYDRHNYTRPVRMVFSWDGERLGSTQPIRNEPEILDAMEDSAAGWLTSAASSQVRRLVYFCILVLLTGGLVVTRLARSYSLP